METEVMSEYERKRLENIKRNGEMIASLNIHSHLSHLSASSKRLREKSCKVNLDKKKPKSESPVVVPMRVPLPLKPLGLRQTYEGVGSHLALVLKLGRFTTMPQSNLEEDNIAPRVPGRRKSQSATKNQPDIRICDSKYHSEFERVKLEEPIDPHLLRLEDENIARVVPGFIYSVRFFPTKDMTMVVAGNKYGHLGFWDVKPQQGEEEDVNHLYRPHSAPISGISIHPFALSKVYSSCYDGILRMMNIEREKFLLLYASANESKIYALGHQPNDVNSLYIGEGSGLVNLFDQRVGKISASWALHLRRTKSIDFSPANSNIMATSSTDGFTCLWDLRNMKVSISRQHPARKSALCMMKHARPVHSAYFSPSGSCLATSVDYNIGVFCGANYEEQFMIPHDHWKNRAKALWGWDDTHLFIGNMKRGVDILSVTEKKKVCELASSNISAMTWRYDAHPCNVGMLAGATSGGQVYISTPSW